MKIGVLEFNLGIEAPPVETVSDVLCRNLESEDMMNLALMELGGLTRRNAISSFRFSGRPELSFVALRKGMPIGFCLVTDSLDRIPEIIYLTAFSQEVELMVLQSTLAALWEAECTRVIYLQVKRPECLGQVGFERACVREQLAVAKCYLEVGKLDKAQNLYPDGEPENLTFLRNQSSLNRLFWLDLHDFEDQPTGSVVPLTRRHILASAPLLFESFGDDPDWISSFLKCALDGCSVGLVQDENVAAGCFAGTVGFATIWSICVGKNLRCQGVGSKLLAHSLDRLKKAGHRTVIAHVREANQASIRLFEKAGFKKIDTIQDLLELGKAAGCLRKNCIHFLPEEDALVVKQACLEAGIKLIG